MNPENQQDDIMHNIQDMIGNLMKSAIEKAQKTEMSEQLGSAAQAAANESETGEPGETSAASLMQAQMDITEIKKIVYTMQKFLDSISSMISQLESGTVEYSKDNDKFLDDYIDTADNIFEIAAFSMKDNVTGLSNRYGFDNRLVLECSRAARDKSTLSLLLIRIDGYKSYKDAYGNQQGDALLQTAAKTLKESIKRATDFIARLDDDFAVILPLTIADGTKIVAERILREIENMIIPFADEDRQAGKISVRIGVRVQMPSHNEQAAEFLLKAQNALKKACEAGDDTRIVIDGSCAEGSTEAD